MLSRLVFQEYFHPELPYHTTSEISLLWYSSSFFILFFLFHSASPSAPCLFLKCHQCFSTCSRDKRFTHLVNVHKSLQNSLLFYKQNKTKKIKDDPCIKHILSQYFGSQCSVLAKLLLLLLWNLLLPQQPWINFRPSGISIWVIHGNVWALNLGWHSFLYFQLHPDWSLEIVKKWETDHPELNFILSFPVLSLPGFILKGRDLCSLLHFKEQWMKCSFVADFLNVWKTLIFCIFSMH